MKCCLFVKTDKNESHDNEQGNDVYCRNKLGLLTILVCIRSTKTMMVVTSMKIILPGRMVKPNSLVRSPALERKSRNPSSCEGVVV